MCNKKENSKSYLSNKDRLIAKTVIVLFILLFVLICVDIHIRSELIDIDIRKSAIKIAQSQCMYCSVSDKTYNNDINTTILFPIKETEVSIWNLSCVVNKDKYNTEWYLCVDDKYNFDESKNLPSNWNAAYHFVEINNCPFCGKKLI